MYHDNIFSFVRDNKESPMMKSKQKKDKSIKISKPKKQFPEIIFITKYNFKE